jgi:hypothetical protein
VAIVDDSEVRPAAPGLSFSIQEVVVPKSEALQNNPSDVDVSTGDGASRLESLEIDVPAASGSVTGRIYYVYGIMSSEHETLIDSNFPNGMTDSSRVFVIDGGELSAIVSLEKADTFGEIPLKRHMKKTSWLKDKVRRHASILFEIRKYATLVPLRFGMTCASSDDVAELIFEQQRHFEKTLKRLHGKSEFRIRMYCDMNKLFGAISKSEDTLDASLDDMPRGVSRFLKGVISADSARDFTSAEDLRESCIRRAHGVLLDVSAEGTYKTMVDHIDDEGNELVMDAAYLVPTESVKKFGFSIERLAKEYADLGFTFEKSGPWPPFHFVGADEDEDSDFMARMGI